MTFTVVRDYCAPAVILLGFLSACAFTPHETELHSTAVPGTSDVGRGTTVFFKFVDERDDTVVGHRAVGGNGAKITAENLPATIEADLRDALTKKGFSIVPTEPGSNSAVTYRLRSFKFDIAAGFFSGEQNSTAALAVEARQKDRTYDHVYRYGNEERTIVVPTGGQIDDQMSAGLTAILAQAYGDSALDAFLVGR